MKWLSFPLLLLLGGCGGTKSTGLPSPVTHGDETSNGGGIAEKNVLYAAQQIDRMLLLCLPSAVCRLNAEEAAAVSKVRAQLAQAPLTTERILFASERQTPGVFQLDGKAHGAVRSAKTTVNSAIYLNTDHLYAGGQPISIPSASALLLDELAHGVEPAFANDEKHRQLDALCAKFQHFMEKVRDEFPLGGGRPTLTAYILHSTPFSDVVISDGEHSLDLMKIFLENNLVVCATDNEKLESADVDLVDWLDAAEVTYPAYRLPTAGYGVFETPASKPAPYSDGRTPWRLNLQMRTALVCRGKKSTRYRQHLEITLAVTHSAGEPGQRTWNLDTKALVPWAILPYSTMPTPF